MAVVEVSIIPLGTSSPGVSVYVAGCLRVLQDIDDVRYQLTPMGTILEGDLDRVLEIVRMMHEQPFAGGIDRVVTSIRIDDRRDKNASMDAKLASVENKF